MPWRESGRISSNVNSVTHQWEGEPQALLAVDGAGGLCCLGLCCHLTWSCPTKLYLTRRRGLHVCTKHSHKCIKTSTHTGTHRRQVRNICQELVLLHFPAVCNFETWHGWVTSATRLVINLMPGLSWKCYPPPLLLDNKLKSRRYPSLFKH